MRVTIDRIGIILRTGDCHLDVKHRLARPVALARRVKRLITRGQGIFRALAIRTISDNRF